MVSNVQGLGGSYEMLWKVSDDQIAQTPEAVREQIATSLRTMGQAQLADRFMPIAKNQAGITMKPVVAQSGPATAGPHDNYSHYLTQAGSGYSQIQPEAKLVLPSGIEVKGKTMAKFLDLRNKLDPKGAAAFMAKNGIVRLGDGNYVMESTRVGLRGDASGVTAPKTGLPSWAPAVAGGAGLLLGGLPLAVTAFLGTTVASKVMANKNAAGNATAAGNASAATNASAAVNAGAATSVASGALSVNAMANNATNMGVMGNTAAAAKIGALGTQATLASAAGQEGLAAKLRFQMHSIAQEQGDNQMIAMIQSGGMPIEDLIFYFMAHMCDDFEQKLKDKMEEQLQQKKVEDQNDRNTAQHAQTANLEKAGGNAVGGIVGTIFGGLVGGGIGQAIGGTVGQVAASGETNKAQQENETNSAINGNAKSSTVLASEVEMLTDKWKRMTEMMSNLMKTMHDMAMTPIRNLR
jgi:hypothetical protein